MSSVSWQSLPRDARAEILAYVNSIHNPGSTYEGIPELVKNKFNVEVDRVTLRKRLSDFGLSKEVKEPIEETMDYEEKWETFNKFIGRKDRKGQIKAKEKQEIEKRLVISDLHAPFARMDALYHILDNNQDVVEVIIAGDLVDMYSLSQFPKYKIIPIKEELSQATLILELCSQVAPTTLISDNHSKRALKYFSARIPSEYLELVSWDILGLLTSKLPNVTLHKQQYTVPDGSVVSVGHFLQRGSAIIGHFETSGKPPAKGVENAFDWLIKWGEYLKMPHWDCLMQAHSHRLAKVIDYGGEKLKMEIGCLVNAEGVEYGLTGDTKFSPPQNGWVILVQERGKTNFNATNFFSI